MRLGLFLASAFAALTLRAAAQDNPQFRLSLHSIHGQRQDTVTYDFNGDGRIDLLSTAVDYKQDPPVRWINLHLQTAEGGFGAIPDQLLPIDDRAAQLVFGNFDDQPGVDVGFLAPDGVYIYPRQGNRLAPSPRKLLHARVFFNLPSPFTLPIWQWEMDLDSNRLDDLILPTDTGYKIYFQTEPGRFCRVCNLEDDEREPARRTIRVAGRAEIERFRATTLNFQKAIPRLEPVDINADGRYDLVMVSGDKITIFFMNEKGTYESSKKKTFVVQTLNSKDEAGAIEVARMQFLDLNGDRFPELVVTRIEGQLGMVESLQTNIYVHRGNGTGNFFPDHSVFIPGLSLFPTFIDMDGDGRADLYATFVSTGVIQKMVDAAIMGDIPISTGFWRYQDKFAEMDYEHSVLVKVGDVEKKTGAGVPLAHVRGDLSGDGRPDMVMVSPEGELRIHRGRKHFRGAQVLIGFESNPSTSIRFEEYPSYVNFVDLNGDSILDMILHYEGSVGVVLSKR